MLDGSGKKGGKGINTEYYVNIKGLVYLEQSLREQKETKGSSPYN